MFTWTCTCENVHLPSMGGWLQRTRGNRRTACAQGRYVTTRGYAPLEPTALGAGGTQNKPFCIVTPTRANSEGKLQG